MKPFLTISLVAVLLSIGCVAEQNRILDLDDQTQLQKRSYQSRVFDTSDKEKVLRAVISTLQDLGFVIDRADLLLGTISATKFEGYQIKITVSVRPKGSESMLVRANAQYNIKPINEPKQYQDFFTSLEKSLFLQAHEAE